MSRPVVALLGAGRLAEAVARVLGKTGVQLRVWARRADARADFEGRHPGSMTAEIAGVAGGATLVIFAVPAHAIAEVAESYGAVATGDQLVLHATRGVGKGFLLPHQLIRSKTCVRKIGCLGGPLHAHELESGRPLAAVLASRYDELSEAMKAITAGTPVRIHPTKDLIGVEVAGAISNVSALAAGMADALNLGETARGVLLTHGLAEARRLGVALGAEASTFTGLAGVGDLIPRRVSSTDRHHEVGARMVRLGSLAAAMDGIHKTVEGLITAEEVMPVAERLSLKLPLLSAVHAILHQNAAPQAALEEVLMSDLDL